MTSLISWLGVDSRGPSSIYLASDSRISFTSGGTWDQGRKVFACNNAPELLGYMGQVLFPSQALSQIQGLINAGFLFKSDAPPEEKREMVFRFVKSHFQTYPVERNSPFIVVYCTRSSERMSSTFCAFTLSWDSGWREEALLIPAASGIIRAWGSGEAAVDRWYRRWINTRQGGRTSRSVFSAFCDALAIGEDPLTGGAPQLVGLYRRGGGISFGIVFGGARYFFGVPILDPVLLAKVEWRNALFECCSGQTMKRLNDAQRHQRPRGLGKAL